MTGICRHSSFCTPSSHDSITISTYPSYLLILISLTTHTYGRRQDNKICIWTGQATRTLLGIWVFLIFLKPMFLLQIQLIAAKITNIVQEICDIKQRTTTCHKNSPRQEDTRGRDEERCSNSSYNIPQHQNKPDI